MNINYLEKKFHEKQNFIFCVVIFTIFFMILFLNCLTPLAADDFAYSFVFGSPEKISSFTDVLKSQWLHYFNWGGRSVVHFIVQTFLWWGKPIFNILNSIVFVMYIYLISFFAFGRKSTIGFICSLLIVWFTLPVIGSIIFWLTGSCNYLWGMTLVFLFMYRYYKCILNEENQISLQNRKDSLLWIIPWFLYGIIAGWCNENTSGMGILVCFLLTLYKYKKSKKIFKWQIFGIIGSILGFVLMILAPGNYARADAFDTSPNPIKRLMDGFIRADAKTFMAEGIYGVIFFLFLFTYLFMVIIPTIDKERKLIGGIWFVGALACNYAMALSPYYPERASCSVYSMCFISIFYAADALIESFTRQKNISNALKVVIFIGCLYFLVSYIEASYDIGLTYLRNNERVEFVLSEKSKGNLDISVPKITEPITKYNIYSTVSDWPQYNAQGYFGVNSISTY